MVAFKLKNVCTHCAVFFFFQLSVGFKFFKIEVDGEEKEKGLWIFGTLLIGLMVTGLFFLRGDYYLQKVSFKTLGRNRELSGKIFGRYRIGCDLPGSKEMSLLRMSVAWVSFWRVRISSRGLRVLQPPRVVSYAGIGSFRLALKALSGRGNSSRSMKEIS